MRYKKYKSQHFLSVSTFICCLCVLALTVSGCTPLRRKFTRKKKKDRELSQKFIPILEPVDYPKKVYSSRERYKHHYSLWRVWDRDLLQTIERHGSDKRQKYLLGQVIEQLEEMRKLLADEKQVELTGLIDNFQDVRQVYEKPVAMRNKFSIRKKIELNAKKIRNGFAPDPSLSYRELDPEE